MTCRLFVFGGAVCGELAPRGHRWEPGTLIFMFLSFLHNYHILMFPSFPCHLSHLGLLWMQRQASRSRRSLPPSVHPSVPAAVSEQLFRPVDWSIWQRPRPRLAFQVDIVRPVIRSDSVPSKWELISAVTWHHVEERVKEQRSAASDGELFSAAADRLDLFTVQ